MIAKPTNRIICIDNDGQPHLTLGMSYNIIRVVRIGGIYYYAVVNDNYCITLYFTSRFILSNETYCENNGII